MGGAARLTPSPRSPYFLCALIQLALEIDNELYSFGGAFLYVLIE